MCLPKTVDVRLGAGIAGIDSGLLGWILEFLLFVFPSSSLRCPDFDCYNDKVVFISLLNL